MKRRWVVLTFCAWPDPVEGESTGYFPVFDTEDLAQEYGEAVEQWTGETSRVVLTDQYWPAEGQGEAQKARLIAEHRGDGEFENAW